MSLRTRLALGLTLAVAIGALAFALLARTAVQQVLYAQVDDQLRAEVRRTSQEVERRGGGGGRPFGGPRGPRPGAFFGRGAIYAQVTAPDGTVLLRTSAVDAIGGMPEPDARTETGLVVLRSERIGEERFRVAETQTQGGNLVQVARPLAELGRFLRTLLWVLLVGGVVAVVSAIGFGRWAARATLRPVEAMTRTARTIARSPRDLSARVEPAFPDPELAEFAGAMNEMLDSIAAADSHQRRFVADASHELRTPLTSLGGNAAYLQRTAALDDDGAEALAAVRRDVDRLIRIADGLTVLARLDAAPVRQLEPVDLDAAAAEAIRQARAARPDHVWELRGEAGVRILDSELVRRILANLLDNAGRYTPPGTHVLVELSGTAADATILVQDDGPGIPDAEFASVLERFHRGSTAAGTAGTGLGLAIVSEAAAALGGELQLGRSSTGGLACTVRLRAGSGDLGAG